MWSNFHSHSRYCDGVGELSEYAEEAVLNDFISIGFSAHAPVPFPCKWCMKKEDLEGYLLNIDLMKKQYPGLQIYKGLEADFIPGVVSPGDFKSQLDYTVGSIHFVGQFDNGTPWEIDGKHDAFLLGLEMIYRNDIREVISLYFELTRKMISTDCPSIVGHMDKIKIQNPGEKFFKESDTWYNDEVIKTLAVIADAQTIVEVNTRGLYQKKTSTTYPSPWILEILNKKHIPITLSSDAHHPKDLINQFPETAIALHKIGFKKIHTLLDGSWQPVTLTPDGIRK